MLDADGREVHCRERAIAIIAEVERRSPRVDANRQSPNRTKKARAVRPGRGGFAAGQTRAWAGGRLGAPGKLTRAAPDCSSRNEPAAASPTAVRMGAHPGQMLRTQPPPGGYLDMHSRVAVTWRDWRDWIIGPIARLWRRIGRWRALRRKGYR